jgi:hypothetical protein
MNEKCLFYSRILTFFQIKTIGKWLVTTLEAKNILRSMNSQDKATLSYFSKNKTLFCSSKKLLEP